MTVLRCLLLGRVVASLSLREIVPFDREAYVYDPRGRVLQIEYAERAADTGALLYSKIVNDDIAIICAWKPREGTKKIYEADDGTFFAFTGLRSDGGVLLDFSRRSLASERLACPEERPSPKRLARILADTMHAAARGGGDRAYGVHLLIAGINRDRPEFWIVSPSGSIIQQDHIKHDILLGGGGKSSSFRRRLLSILSDRAVRDHPEKIIAALAQAAFYPSSLSAEEEEEEEETEDHENDELRQNENNALALEVLVYRRDPRSPSHSPAPRVLAWLAELRREDILRPEEHDAPVYKERSEYQLHPRAAASLAAALSEDDDAAVADAALADVSIVN